MPISQMFLASTVNCELWCGKFAARSRITIHCSHYNFSATEEKLSVLNTHIFSLHLHFLQYHSVSVILRYSTSSTVPISSTRDAFAQYHLVSVIFWYSTLCHSVGLTPPKTPTSKKKSINVVNDELSTKRRVGTFWKKNFKNSNGGGSFLGNTENGHIWQKKWTKQNTRINKWETVKEKRKKSKKSLIVTFTAQ